MNIGIISDTHDHHENVLKAVETFKRHKVRYIFHAGDIIAPFSAKPFLEIDNVKFIAVFGNNDGEKFFLKSTIEKYGGEIHEDCFKAEIAGRKIFMTHKEKIIDEVAESKKYDLIIYGHTHEQDIRTVGRTLIVNPGETTDWMTDKSSVVILKTQTMKHQVISLR